MFDLTPLILLAVTDFLDWLLGAALAKDRLGTEIALKAARVSVRNAIQPANEFDLAQDRLQEVKEALTTCVAILLWTTR